MKKIYPLFIVALFFLGCTETEYKEIIKYVDRPAPALAPTFITDTIHTVDTVEVKVVVHETDTVIKVVTKEVIKVVEKIVNHYDTTLITEIDTVFITLHDTTTLTVYDRTVIYKDTFWVIDPFNMVTFFPNEVAPYIAEFAQSCWDRGLQVTSMPLLVQYSNNLPGENWSSFSYIVGFQQMIIEISDKLPAEQQRAGILRELNRLQRNKKYTAVPDRIMNPLFDPAATITAAHLNELYK